MVRRPAAWDSSAVSGSFREAPSTPATTPKATSRPTQAFRRAAVRELAEEVGISPGRRLPGLRLSVGYAGRISRVRYDTHFYLAPLRRRCR